MERGLEQGVRDWESVSCAKYGKSVGNRHINCDVVLARLLRHLCVDMGRGFLVSMPDKGDMRTNVVFFFFFLLAASRVTYA